LDDILTVAELGCGCVAVFTTVLSTILVILLALVSLRLEQRAWEQEKMHQVAQKKEAEQMDEEKHTKI
jgi:uncharacterized protein YacL